MPPTIAPGSTAGKPPGTPGVNTRASEPGSFVDLHAHSTASDGTCSPEELIAAAVRAGLSAIAITDHDTLAGVPAALAAGERLGIRVVPGVELSVMDGEREIHLLGLHIAQYEALEFRLTEIRGARRTRALEIVAKLNTLGVPLTEAAVFAGAGDGAIGRPHVARALIAGGWVRDQREAFDRYLGAGRPANVPKQRVTMAEGIQMVHDTGGLAIIAHPGSEIGRRARIEPLIPLGLDGIEVRHPSHSAEDIARLTALVNHFGLSPSGGSDWHGAAAGPRLLGMMHVPIEWLQRQDAYCSIRSSAATPAVP